MAEFGAQVVVVGDGPAGSALAAALTRVGVDVLLVGPDRPWEATYGTWTDDINGCGLVAVEDDVWQFRTPAISARFHREISISREYGVIDNEALRRVLRSDVSHHTGVVECTADVDGRIIVDATGWPPALDREPACEVGWQTAFGVVLEEPPAGLLGRPLLMDYAAPSRSSELDEIGVPTFAYALPVIDGWLVEETVLVASPMVEPERLAPRLAARVGMPLDDLLSAAIRTESVRIPMGVPPAHASGNVMRYGAAAGMINPVTGYSIATSMCAASPMATALAQLLRSPDRIGATQLDGIVWPKSARRTRALHDYGLDVIGRLDADRMRTFFESFFDLPTPAWSAYLRIDTSPAAISQIMWSMFRGANWPLRRALVSSRPGPLLRLPRG